MELTTVSAQGNSEPARSFIIDLNESPSFSSSSSEYRPSDAFSLVRRFHGDLSPPAGAPALLPQPFEGSTCPACGQTDDRKDVVVCDGCERGFHLSCSFMQREQMDEWKCGECIGNAVPCNRWPLGRKTKAKGQKQGAVRLLDINSLPISDGEGEEITDVPHSRKRTPEDNSFGVPVHAEKGLDFQQASNFVLNSVKASFEDKLPHKQTVRRIFEEVDSNSVPGKGVLCINNSNPAIESLNKYPVKMHLHALREYILERHGVIEEGWHVDFKQLIPSGEVCAVYCAPNGKTFESMADVASYLGLKSHGDNVRPAIRSHAPSPLHQNLARRNLTEAGFEDTGGSEPRKLNDGLLPVQYEDFFILSVGRIISESSYHSVNQIWPIGYKSCWHDKITGSVFTSEVSNGGDFGPVFKVTRRSCLSVSIPDASTVLYSTKPVKTDLSYEEKHDALTCSDGDYDGDSNILMILSEPSPPGEDDIISCLGIPSATQSKNEGSPVVSDNLVFTDEIGEFTVEGSSSSSAWSKANETLIHIFRRLYMQKGTIKFFCKHAEGVSYANDMDKFAALSKFCGVSDSIKIPYVIRSYTELETLIEELSKWVDQDRFGLDAEFVQEIVEQLPGAEACSSYVFLNERNLYSSSLIVGNGNLLLKTKDKDVDPVVNDHFLPPGNPISSRVPPQLIGDVLQISEQIGRFYDVLDLKEPLSIEELEKELITPCFDGLGEDIDSRRVNSTLSESSSANSVEDFHAFIRFGKRATKEIEQSSLTPVTYTGSLNFGLTKVHSFLVKTLVSELQSKVATATDYKPDNGDVKPKRGRKKDTDSLITANRNKLIMLPLNQLTWPELARRFILVVLAMNGNHDSAEVISRESAKASRCLQGDGGVLCGSMTGVTGIEADAQLLAEASKKIFGSLNQQNNILLIEEDETDVASSSETLRPNTAHVPEWAKALEPVKKLPTNVGARIRKCINDALSKGPPEWAKKILEHSISKEVYKGNASGPTKKAVLSVLEKVNAEGLQQKIEIPKKKKRSISISDIIMRKCRIVLRRAAASDEDKTFCNLLGRKLMICSDNDDEGILGAPAVVSRPLDFRTIDLRLAVGVYGGSHKAFIEDVQEFWTNVRSVYADQPDLVKLARTLSENFESLYEKEVVTLVDKLAGYTKLESLNAESMKEVEELLTSVNDIPKAPWEEGVCKVCGIDRDDNSVLLCDTCDAEYHFYCLNPPLARIPEGNWYCPSCVAGKQVIQDGLEGEKVIRRHRKRIEGEFTRMNLDTLAHLVTALEEREYWELSVDERILLLKFLCDELLSSALIRQHLEKSAEASADLQQKLRSLYVEWKTLRCKEEKMALRAAKTEKSSFKSFGFITGESSVNTITKNTQINKGDTVGDSQSAGDSMVDVTESVPSDFDARDTNEGDPKLDIVEMNKVKNDISLLQKSIASIETELMKLSARREFLGRDSFGRLYWMLVKWSPHPSLMAKGNAEFHPRLKIICYNDSNPMSSTWVCYQSEAEIKELVNCLIENDPMERELKESILHWQKLGFHGDEGENLLYRSTNSTNSKESCSSLISKATSLLENKYGPCFQSQAIDLSKKRTRKAKLNSNPEPYMYRCECLESVWQSRNHCVSCHKTLFTNAEFEKHSDGKCNVVPLAYDKTKDDIAAVKGKGTMHLEPGPNLIKFQSDGVPCPFDFEDICSKFVIKSSNKELVKEIGLIGSNGVPSFVSVPSYLEDPALMLMPFKENIIRKTDENLCPMNTEFHDDGTYVTCDLNDVIRAKEEDKADARSCGRIEANCCVVPEAALKSLSGEGFNILKQLKIILLDMDAMLSEEAIRPSRANPERRQAWREFVKSAQMIYEMVQALMVFEDAISSEVLANTWWYWSSFSAAAKISTLSALALRIYSLDAAINYQKFSSDNDPLTKIEHVPQTCSDSAEKIKSVRRTMKKRKEPET